MAKQHDLDMMYMRQAYEASMLSYATRRKVGAMFVVPNEGRFEGINGTPAGFDNDPEHDKHSIMDIGGVNVCAQCQQVVTEEFGCPVRTTKPECLHAEANALMKVAKSHCSSIGGTMYCTLAPCYECAKMIIQAEVARVVYSEVYPLDDNSSRSPGLILLRNAGIVVDRLDLSSQYNRVDLNPHEKDLEGHNQETIPHATEDMHYGHDYH